jgi:hypothetical protein
MQFLRRRMLWYVAYTLAVFLVLAPYAHAQCPLSQCHVCQNASCVGTCDNPAECGMDVNNIYYTPYCNFYECWEGTCYRLDGQEQPGGPCYVCQTESYRCCPYSSAECDMF